MIDRKIMIHKKNKKIHRQLMQSQLLNKEEGVVYDNDN